MLNGRTDSATEKRFRDEFKNGEDNMEALSLLGRGDRAMDRAVPDKFESGGSASKVPAIVEPGEWILGKETVDKYGDKYLHDVNAMKFASFMATPIKVLNATLSFVSIPLLSLTSIIEKRLGKKQQNFSVEKLSQALEITSEEATTKDEQKILEGIVNFGNTDTAQVMCPRMDVFALSDDEIFLEVVKKIIRKGHSRIPVYKDTIDEVIGVLYTKDLLPHLNKKTFQWKKVLREPFFVPENKKLDDLLKEFQEMKNHLAIVVDEYGGTSGIVTLEDIIEEIVGDISDEFDDDDLAYSKLDDHNYVFDGKIVLKDFYKVLDDIDETTFEETKGEAETLAGFILEISGKFPEKNEVVQFNEYQFKIEALDKKRIKQVKVTLPNE